MSFEHYSEQLAWIFQTLAKDDEETLSERQKVEKLLEGINTDNTQLLAAKTFTNNQYSHNFVHATEFFSCELSRIHGPAQLEIQKGKERKEREEYCLQTGPTRVGTKEGTGLW